MGRGEILFDAKQVTVISIGLVVYIILYAIYLVYLVINTSRETKLIQRYSSKKSAVDNKRIAIAIIGGVLAGLLFSFYLKYV